MKYECGQEPRFACPYCNYRSKWSENVYKHQRVKHEGQIVHCIDILADPEDNQATVKYYRDNTK